MQVSIANVLRGGFDVERQEMVSGRASSCRSSNIIHFSSVGNEAPLKGASCGLKPTISYGS